MARMIPQTLRPNLNSMAEQKLYTALALQLPDDFTVFHRVAWQVRDARHGAQDGEADFIVAHPQLGVVTIEVKGGAIRYDGAAGQWYSNDIPIKDPFEQARRSKYNLLDKLHELLYWRNRWFTFGYAVAFPDVVVEQRALRPDAPREIVLDARDMGNLLQRVTEILMYAGQADARSSALGASGIEQLMQLLSPSLQLRSPLSVQIVEEEQELIRLTEEQFRLLDFLSRHRQTAICGCAGSGKTMLAVEKARRLASEHFRVLLTCYNRYLAEFLQASLSTHPNLRVVHFHGLCMELIRKAGLQSNKLPNQSDQQFFDRILPEGLLDAASILGPQYDAIIIDEGQDFHEDWILTLKCLLHDSDKGILYVFFDDNQNLYRVESNQLLPLAPFPLTHNCRNTRHIHNIVNRFYRSDHPTIAQGPDGRPINMRVYKDTTDLKRQLQKILHELIVVQGVPSTDIVVLTPKSRGRSTLWQLGMLGNFRLMDKATDGHGEIFCTTIHAFKGLESPVIILTEIDTNNNTEQTRLLYVGSSRACHHLIILHSVNALLILSDA